MNHKTSSWLLIFFLILSIFTPIVFSDPNPGIFLIQNPQGWITAGFNPEGLPVYTPDGLTDFYMPIALKKEDINNLKTSDVEHTILHGNDNFDNRLRSITFEIFESETYWVVVYHMTVFAGTNGFSIDFVPKIKGEELGQFAWWNSDWDKRKDIFIDKDQLKNSVANFPIYINLSDAEMVGDVQTDLGDIAFVDTTNTTKLDHEIEYYSIGATVEARIWVEIPKINGSDHTDDTHINMYYDNAAVANQDNPTGVWDANYLFVYHMNSSTTTTKGCYDSTSNSRHGDYTGNLPTTAVGIVGDGQNLDGTGDHITLINDFSATQLDGTWEIWFNTVENNENDCYIKLNKDASNFVIMSLRQDIGPPLRHDFRGEYVGSPQWNAGYESGIQPFSWNCTMQHWADGDELALWLDDDTGMNLVDKDTSVNTVSIAGGTYYIGSDAGSNNIAGIIDEIRISSIKRNDTWMEATYNTIKNDTTFVTISSEKEDTTTNPITSLTVETQSKTYIACNWTKSSNGEYTLVERNTAAGWARGAGTELYNGTDNSYNDTNCSEYTVYYYQLWAFYTVTKEFSSVEIGNNHTGPTIPTNVESSISGSTINITWTKGTRADNTVIMRKTSSYPSVIADGTEIYNGTATGYDDTGWTNDMYYTLFSFNTTNMLSSNGVDINWGSLNVTCYQENTTTQIFNFTVFVSNQSGTETYEEYSDGKQSINIDVDNLPTGDDVVVKVNASVYINSSITNNYYDRVYYMDLVSGNYYELKAYLPIKTDSFLYRLIVYGPVGEFGANFPIEDANMDILRYINSTSGWDSIGTYLTDGDGNVYVYLIPGELYKITITATGYTSSTSDYIPSSSVFEQVFRLSPTSTTGDELIYDEFWEDIDLSIVMVSSGFFSNGDPQLGNITITYSDSNSSTTNTQLRLYEQYNSSTLLFNTWTNTSSSFNLVNSSINTTRLHILKLWFNTTANYEITQPIIILIPPTDIYIGVTPFNLDDRITNIIGPFPIGDDTVPWTTVIAVSLPMILLVAFGPFNTGLGIISCGMSMFLIEAILGIYNTDGFSWGIAGIGIFIVVTGVIYVMTKSQGGERL